MDIRFYPRQEITTKEFRETAGQVLNTNRKEWIELAKDLEDLGIIKLGGKRGLSTMEINWPSSGADKRRKNL